MKILLHICCANCAIYPVRIFRDEGHNLAGFWFNPNIHPYPEYELRLDSLRGLQERWRIDMIYMDEYKPEEYFKMFNTECPDLSGEFNYNRRLPEGVPPVPERCKYCYNLRLEKTAEQARLNSFDAFSTTLLISPYQDFEQIMSTGKMLQERYGILFYPRDFRGYFREAMSYARELGLYRQKYCGCIYSREDREQKKRSRYA
jgi:hypothetical protein